MEESIKDPPGTLPGKSIFFAVSVNHARRLQDIFDQLYPEHRGGLARVIVADDSRTYGKGGLLDQFKTQDMRRVVISVDMLDTGVDIREVVNLVFAKPVYSYVKFWQMIGRGTRVLETDPTLRKPWCPEKDKFLIVDCWGNFEYFQMNPRGREPGQQVPMPVRLFRARLDKLEVALATGAGDVVEAIKADLRADLEALPANNVVVLERQADLAVLRDDAYWARLGRDGPDGRDLPIAEYRRRVEEAIRQLLAENPVLQRLQTGEEVSDRDLRELAELPRRQDPAIDEDRLRKAYDVRTVSFVQLLKHVLRVQPLERWSTYVTREFERFIAEHTTYTALQIRFLQTLRTFILQRGRVERRDLVHVPFTQLHPQGVRGVFPPREIEEILRFAGGLVA